MLEPRITARIAGGLYLLTHVTSVAAVLLYGGSGFDSQAALAGRTPVLVGGLLEIVLALAVVGTGIALYPLVRAYSRAVAAGYLALRTLEASVILTGVAVLLPVVARPASATAPGLSSDAASALRLVHDWTFLIGPGLIVPIHTALLAVVLLRCRLVPRIVPILGLVGGPLVGAGNLLVMFGLTEPIAATAIPVFAWELGLAFTLLIRGLRPFGPTGPGTPSVPDPAAVPA